MARQAPVDNNAVEKLLYRRKDAAFALSCSVRQIDYLIEQGKLKTCKMGRNTVIAASEVKRLAAAIMKGAA